MPIYEFECEKCELIFEEVRPMSESSKEAECPQCKEKAKKIVSLNAKHGSWTYWNVLGR